MFCFLTLYDSAHFKSVICTHSDDDLLTWIMGVCVGWIVINCILHDDLITIIENEDGSDIEFEDGDVLSVQSDWDDDLEQDEVLSDH